MTSPPKRKPPRELWDRLRRLRRREDYVARWGEALSLVGELNAGLSDVGVARRDLVRQWHEEGRSYQQIAVELRAAGFPITRAHLHKIAMGRADERPADEPEPQA